MTPRIDSDPERHEVSEESFVEPTRRAWIRPDMQIQPSMTTLTQVGPHGPLAMLLFQQLSGQCFDESGHQIDCLP